MDAVVASHTTALRAIRYTRRRSYLLPWREVDEHEQRRALSACSPAARALDWDLLAYSGMVSREAARSSERAAQVFRAQSMLRGYYPRANI